MASISAVERIEEDLYIPVADGTILIVKKIFGGRKRAVLILPGRGEQIDTPLYDDLARDAVDGLTTSYTVEIRGHGRSEGRWSMDEHRKDIDHLLRLLHNVFKSVYVIASGASALVMLEREHKQLIHGMVLLNPEKPPIPIRVQTPTAVLVSSHDDILLKRLFGPVRTRAGWKEPFRASALERSRHVRMVFSALQELYVAEKPIRFKVV